MTGLTSLLGNVSWTLLADDQGTAGAALGGIMVAYLIVLVLMIAGMFAMYSKAGKPGWASIIPIYNIIVLLEIVGRPSWWFLLFFVPVVNLIVAILVVIDLAKSFGKGTGFALLLIFLPFIAYPMLGFGSAKYLGPVHSEA